MYLSDYQCIPASHFLPSIANRKQCVTVINMVHQIWQASFTFQWNRLICTTFHVSIRAFKFTSWYLKLTCLLFSLDSTLNYTVQPPETVILNVAIVAGQQGQQLVMSHAHTHTHTHKHTHTHTYRDRTILRYDRKNKG